MVRLMLVLAPVACILSAIAASSLISSYIKCVKPSRHEPVLGKEAGWIVIAGLAAMLVMYAFHCTWVRCHARQFLSFLLL